MDVRYDFGGDEYIFVDFDIEMSLKVNFKILSICQEIERERIPGSDRGMPRQRVVSDALPARGNRSGQAGQGAAQTRASGRPYHRDQLAHGRHPGALRRSVDQGMRDTVRRAPSGPLGHQPRIPDAHQWLQRQAGIYPGALRASLLDFDGRFRARHRVGLPDGAARARLAGAEVRPPAHGYARAHGLARRRVHSNLSGARTGRLSIDRDDAGAGLTAEGRLVDLRETRILAKAADRWKLRPIDLDEFNAIRAEVEAGTYRYKIVEQEFKPAVYFEDPERYLNRLQEEARACSKS